MNAPKQIVQLAKTIALQISCGAFHTAVVASSRSQIKRHDIDSLLESAMKQYQAADSGKFQSYTSSFRCSDNKQTYPFSGSDFICGDLYAFGLGKAGQTGLGVKLSKNPVTSPMLVQVLK